MIKKSIIVSLMLLGACSTPKMEIRYSCNPNMETTSKKIVKTRDWNEPSFTEAQLGVLVSERLELENSIEDKLEASSCNIYSLRDRVADCASESLNAKVFYNSMNDVLSKSEGYRQYFERSVEHCSWKLYLENYNKCKGN